MGRNVGFSINVSRFGVLIAHCAVLLVCISITEKIKDLIF